MACYARLSMQAISALFGDASSPWVCPCRFIVNAASKTIMTLLIPIVSRLPFEWVYPTGEKQHQRKPKYPGRLNKPA
jgi:hypothetical protein